MNLVRWQYGESRMSNHKLSIDEQVAYLMQGTEYGDEELKKAMTNELRQRLLEAQKEDRPLRVYCGYDPTSTDLHLGHTITMRKLRQFQDLGHDVTFLIGSYTALVGDPSDKNKARPILTEEQKRLLRHFSRSDLRRSFYLKGGTALSACYLFHRVSEDLDFFSREKAGVEKILTLV